MAASPRAVSQRRETAHSSREVATVRNGTSHDCIEMREEARDNLADTDTNKRTVHSLVFFPLLVVLEVDCICPLRVLTSSLIDFLKEEEEE